MTWAPWLALASWACSARSASCLHVCVRGGSYPELCSGSGLANLVSAHLGGLEPHLLRLGPLLRGQGAPVGIPHNTGMHPTPRSSSPRTAKLSSAPRCLRCGPSRVEARGAAVGRRAWGNWIATVTAANCAAGGPGVARARIDVDRVVLYYDGCRCAARGRSVRRWTCRCRCGRRPCGRDRSPGRRPPCRAIAGRAWGQWSSKACTVSPCQTAIGGRSPTRRTVPSWISASGPRHSAPSGAVAGGCARSRRNGTLMDAHTSSSAGRSCWSGTTTSTTRHRDARVDRRAGLADGLPPPDPHPGTQPRRRRVAPPQAQPGQPRRMQPPNSPPWPALASNACNTDPNPSTASSPRPGSSWPIHSHPDPKISVATLNPKDPYSFNNHRQPTADRRHRPSRALGSPQDAYWIWQAMCLLDRCFGSPGTGLSQVSVPTLGACSPQLSTCSSPTRAFVTSEVATICLKGMLPPPLTVYVAVQFTVAVTANLSSGFPREVVAYL